MVVLTTITVLYHDPSLIWGVLMLSKKTQESGLRWHCSYNELEAQRGALPTAHRLLGH